MSRAALLLRRLETGPRIRHQVLNIRLLPGEFRVLTDVLGAAKVETAGVAKSGC